MDTESYHSPSSLRYCSNVSFREGDTAPVIENGYFIMIRVNLNVFCFSTIMKLRICVLAKLASSTFIPTELTPTLYKKDIVRILSD